MESCPQDSITTRARPDFFSSNELRTLGANTIGGNDNVGSQACTVVQYCTTLASGDVIEVVHDALPVCHLNPSAPKLSKQCCYEFGSILSVDMDDFLCTVRQGDGHVDECDRLGSRDAFSGDLVVCEEGLVVDSFELGR